jgi:hypothetical protein
LIIGSGGEILRRFEMNNLEREIEKERALERFNLENLGKLLSLFGKAVETMGGRIEGIVSLDAASVHPSISLKIEFTPSGLHEYILQSQKQGHGNDPEGR